MDMILRLKNIDLSNSKSDIMSDKMDESQL